MTGKKRPGFALAELVLTLGVGAALLAVVWPKPFLVPSNEKAVVASLRQVAAAQALLAASGAIDTDDDGLGEYGYFGELAGTAPLRFYDPVANAPAIDLSAPVLSPPLLPPAFGNIFFDSLGEDVVRLDGYYFKMFLPDVPILDDISGVPETGVAGIGGATVAGLPGPDTCEVLWCCYAWPVETGITGRRAFFINQEGRVLQTRNSGHPPGSPVYEGLGSLPDFDAAYSNRPASPNGLTGMGAPPGNPPRRANDGNVWTPIGR